MTIVLGVIGYLILGVLVGALAYKCDAEVEGLPMIIVLWPLSLLLFGVTIAAIEIGELLK